MANGLALKLPFFLTALSVASGCLLSQAGGEPSIPLAQAPIRLDRVMGADEWRGALEIDGSFAFDDHRLNATYPFTAMLLADDRYLYVGLTIKGSGPSPWSREGMLVSDNVALVFANERGDLDRKLVVHIPENSARVDDSWWDGAHWVEDPDDPRTYAVRDGLPDGGFWARDATTGHDAGLEMTIPRLPAGTQGNPVPFTKGETFRVLFVYLRLEEHGGYWTDAPSAVWPSPLPLVDAQRDPSSWLELRMP